MRLIRLQAGTPIARDYHNYRLVRRDIESWLASHHVLPPLRYEGVRWVDQNSTALARPPWSTILSWAGGLSSACVWRRIGCQVPKDVEVLGESNLFRIKLVHVSLIRY